MTNTDVQTLILSKLSEYGSHILIIITAVIGVGLAYLVFRFGWKKTKTSLSGGDNFIYHSADDLEFKRNYGNRSTKKTRWSKKKSREFLESL